MTESGRERAKMQAVHEYLYGHASVEDQFGQGFDKGWQAAFEAGRGGWISVDVRLPAEREKVLIVHAAAPDNMHYPKVDVEMAFMADGEWYDAGDTRNMGAFNNETWSIEFWRPLPAPPDSGDAQGYEWQCMSCSFVTRDEQAAGDHTSGFRPLHAFHRITLADSGDAKEAERG